MQRQVAQSSVSAARRKQLHLRKWADFLWFRRGTRRMASTGTIRICSI